MRCSWTCRGPSRSIRWTSQQPPEIAVEETVEELWPFAMSSIVFLSIQDQRERPLHGVATAEMRTQTTTRIQYYGSGEFTLRPFPVVTHEHFRRRMTYRGLSSDEESSPPSTKVTTGREIGGSVPEDLRATSERCEDLTRGL